MKEKSYWLNSGTYTMLHSGIDFVLGFLGFMMLVRILPQVGFGIWVLLITIISIVEVARKGFLQNGMIRFLVSKKEESREIQSAALLLNILLTLLLMALLWFFAPGIDRLMNAPGLAEIIRIYVILLPVLILHTHNLILLQARYDFRAYFWAGVSKSVPFFLCISYFFWTGTEVELSQLAWLYALCFVFASVVSLAQVRRYLKLSMKISKDWLAQIFGFGKYVFGTNLVSMLSSSMDKFLLGALLSPVQVALANTAGKVLNMTHVPVNSIASISYPKAAEANEKDSSVEVGRMFEQTTGMVLCFTLPFFAVVMLFAEPIIWIIAGEKYLDAAPFLMIVALLALIFSYDRQAGVFLDAIGKPKLNMVMVLINFVLLIILSFLLIQAMGLLGAAWGLVLSKLLTTFVKCILLRKHVPFRWLMPFKEAFFFWGKGYRLAIDKLKTSK